MSEMVSELYLIFQVDYALHFVKKLLFFFMAL